MIAAVPASTPTPIDARTTAAISLRCDVRQGCTIFTPAGEQIQKVYTSDDTLLITVTSDGSSGPGTVEIAPQSTTEKRNGQVVGVDAEVHITVAGASAIGAGNCTTLLPLVAGSTKTYRADVSAVDDGSPHSLAYTYPPLPVCKPPTPVISPVQMPSLPVATDNAEYTDLDPSKLDWGFSSQGDIKCLAVFAIAERHQIWCRLPDSVVTTPVAYISDGTQPTIGRLVAGHYFAVDDATDSVTLIWNDGTQTKIVRAR
jgi:hypothetical protein